MWFLVCVNDFDKHNLEKATIDLLERVRPGQNQYWRHPMKPDLCNAELKQILGVEQR